MTYIGISIAMYAWKTMLMEELCVKKKVPSMDTGTAASRIHTQYISMCARSFPISNTETTAA